MIAFKQNDFVIAFLLQVYDFHHVLVNGIEVILVKMTPIRIEIITQEDDFIHLVNILMNRFFPETFTMNVRYNEYSLGHTINC